MLAREGRFFEDAGSEEAVCTGVWSLAYLRLAHDYLKARAPKVRLAISGRGGGAQLPGVFRGLARALPRDIVFSCLSPNQGGSAHPTVLAEIGKHRPVGAIPWLEGDARLRHLQPRVSLLREHVQLAEKQGLNGVLAIRWRTEEVRANLEAFAQFAADPVGAPTVEAFYQRDGEAQFGKPAAEVLVPSLAGLDREQAIETPSPEYFPYDPTWGRLKPGLRERLDHCFGETSRLERTATDPCHQSNLAWLADNLAFTLLLDQVSRCLEPAYQLKDRWLRGEGSRTALRKEVIRARAVFAKAPLERLCGTFARRVPSKGELGELSFLNQRLWRQYQELDGLLAGLEKASPTQ